MAHPDSYSGHERRRSGRVISRRPVLLFGLIDGQAHYETALTFSLSQYGCAVTCDVGFAPATPVRLEYDGKRLAGRVTFLLQSSKNEGFEMGIAFDEDASAFWGEKFEK